jgi:pyrroline-5-carboxylate reductase
MKIAIIGYGSMGKMLLEKIISSKLIPESNIYVANRTFGKIEILKEKYTINICKTNAEAAENSDIIFICVRPADIKTVLEEIMNVIDHNKHIVSLNGSIGFEQLEKICTGNKISKVIPGITAEVNESQTLVCHNSKVNEKDKSELNKILESFGSIIELPEEEMGMGAELVSCMPGFIAALFNEIKKSAQKHTKIEENKIVTMLADTMIGTGRLIIENKMTFEEVIERVATKGGITEEGTNVIENDFPKVAAGMFNKTLEKRKTTTENSIKAFGK